MVDLEEIIAACHQQKKELGVTYQELANAAGLELFTVQDLLSCRHRKNPGIFVVGHVCGALGVSLDQFFYTGVPGTMRNRIEREKNIAALKSVRDCLDSTPAERLEAIKILREVEIHD